MRWRCFLSSTMIPYMWSLRSWTSWYVLRLKLTLHKFFPNLKSELLFFLVYIYFTTTVVNSLEYNHIELTGYSWRNAGCSVTVHNKEHTKHFYMIVHYQNTSFMCMLSCYISFHIVVGNYCVIPNNVYGESPSPRNRDTQKYDSPCKQGFKEFPSNTSYTSK